MNDIIFCDLWDEEDGIYVQFDDDFDITSNEYRDIFNKLINELGYEESGGHELFYSCCEPSWSDLANVREEVTKAIIDLGYRIEWL